MKDTSVKHSLGKLLLFILLCTLLGAEDFSFDAQVDVPHPFVKEPVILQVDLKRTNPDIVVLFTFDLKPSPDYTFRRIDSKEIDRYHDAKVHYTYLIYPLRSGKIDIGFDLTKRVTNDESVKESFAGDRDTVKFLETKDSKVNLPPLSLEVKPLPKGTQLVGDFTLRYELGTTHAKAFEPIAFRVTISGKGYPPLVEPLVKTSGDFTLFTEKPIVKSRYTQEGTYSTVTYPMALSAKKDFTLPHIQIAAFDPKQTRSYQLSIPQTRFTIEAPDVNTLVDKVDTPKPYRLDMDWVGTLIKYLIVFGAGFASGWLWRRQRRERTRNTVHPLVEKIDTVKEKKALLQLLVAHDATTFAPVIAAIEADLYDKKSTPLKTLKHMAKELLDAH